jgi:hypothetical protein
MEKNEMNKKSNVDELTDVTYMVYITISVVVTSLVVLQ